VLRGNAIVIGCLEPLNMVVVDLAPTHAHQPATDRHAVEPRAGSAPPSVYGLRRRRPGDTHYKRVSFNRP